MAYRRRYRNKKRIREVHEIEAALANHAVRYERHLMWVNRKKHLSERTLLYCAPIQEEIYELKINTNNYKKFLGLFRTQTLTETASHRLDQLQAELKKLEQKASLEIPVLEFPYERYPNRRRVYSDWHTIPQELNEELAKARKIRAEKLKNKEKQLAIKAKIAEVDGKTRDLAGVVKAYLSKDHPCPYCGGELGLTPHADHIYPVSKGGRSTVANMVYVCANCNLSKKDKTLMKFIKDSGRDRDLIEQRLTELRKEF